MLLSVVIPTRHRNDLLRQCLASLAPGAQTLPAELYEVVVTDDGANDTAEAMVRQDFPWARWTQGPRRGPAANRNHGAKMTGGDWLAFIDDDCYADKDWLKAIAELARAGGVEVVEGKTTIPHKADRPLTHSVENLRGGVYWSCNLAVRAALFQRLGGFDEDFLEAGGEDMEFAFRLRKLRVPAVFCAPALVWHPQYPIGFRHLLRRVRQSRWIILYAYKTGEGLDPSWPVAKCLGREIVVALPNALRTTKQFFLNLDRREWKSQTFGEVWKWATLLPVTAVKLWWTVKFRRPMAARK